MKEAVLLVIFASILAAVYAAPCCGDGRCEYPAENCRSCAKDCGVCPKCTTCGNKICDVGLGENPCNCPLDCGPCCVDNICREDKNETALNCPQDCGLALRILVVDDATNVPLPQAAVRCSTPIVTLGPKVTSASGKVQFDNAEGAKYFCSGELFGYLPGSVQATVYPKSEPVTYVIRLKKNLACLEGTVYDIVTFVPLDNSTVFCSNSDKSFITSSRITGRQGKYYFEPVPPGDYRCFATRPEYSENSNDGSVEPGMMGVIDIYLAPLPGGLIGHVYVMNGTELVGIPGATITCTGAANAPLPVVTTDSTGFYSIQKLNTQPVSCTASLPDYTSDSKVGVILRGRNTTIDFVLTELPGSLLVRVLEEVSLINIPHAAVTCESVRSPLLAGLTDVNATVFFGTVASGTFTCSASAQYYFSNSTTGIVVVRNRKTEVTILLKPHPGTLIITTVDDTTDEILVNTMVTLNSLTPQYTDATGTTQYTVPQGTYSSTGSLFGYISGFKNNFPVPKGVVTRVQLRLVPLPGTLIVNVIATDRNNGPVPGATVVVDAQTAGVVFTNTSTAPEPTATLTYSVKPGVYRAAGSARGYNNDTKLSAYVGRNLTVTVTLVLTPLPNAIIVQVLDAADGQPITSAQVGLTGSASLTSSVDALAKSFFNPLAGGNYSANAQAPGYAPNSTHVGVAVRNDTLFAVIYLAQLPGGIIGHVWVNQTGTLVALPGATINCTVANAGRPTATTDLTGFYSIQNVVPGSASCTASLVDYTSESKSGVVLKGQNTTIDFILYELPGQLIVHVMEETTNVVIPGSSVRCTSTHPALDGLTDVNGTIGFGTVWSGVYDCSASATDYLGGSATGVTVNRNKRTEITIYLKPLPGTLIITTVDDTTGDILTAVSVSVFGAGNFGPQTTGNDGTTQFTVPANTYSSTGSLTGYLSGSQFNFSVPKAVITRVTLRLVPLPGILIVNVIATDLNNGPLPGATVVVDAQTAGVVFTNTSTAPNPTATLTYTVKPGVYRAFASAVGYNTDTKLSAAIGRNQTVTVTLVLSPLPNSVIVQVLDIADNSLITTATVTLSGSTTDSSAVNAQARATFGPYSAGNWSATATATGYASNSTYVGAAVRNTTLSAVIYLRQLPCTVNVIVVSNNTGLVVSGATVSLTGITGTTTTDAQGKTTYSLAYNFATNPIASASRAGYNNGSSEIFVCGRGFMVNVTIRLNEVLTIRLAAIDALTSTKPLLPNANIYFNGALVTTVDPANPAFRLQSVQSLPIQAVIVGVAGGFNNKTSDTITFTLTNRAFNISLAPQEFTLFFIPAEVMADGSYQRAGPDGSIKNNYKAFFSETGMVYEEKPITAGGSATQISDPPTSASFTANTPITFTNTSVSPFTAFAARFGEQSPSNQSQFSAFYVQSKDLDTLKANAPNSATQLFVPVPDFAATPERTIVFDLPYKLNAAYFNIRVTPVDAVTFAKRNFGAQDFCFARVTLKRAVRYTNYDSNVLKLATRAIFESFITFGDAVGQIEMGFPVESYNNTLSNWADTETSPFPNVRPYASGAAPEELSKFDWPPTSLLTPLFTTVSATGQVGRNPSAKLFHLQDYVIVYQPRTKRSEN